MNTAVGYNALGANIGGTGNVAVGDRVLLTNTVGYRNTAIGAGAMQGAIGLEGGANPTILYGNTGGYENVAIGNSSLLRNNGSSNVSIGNGAMRSILTGSSNIAIGNNAGSLYTGSESNNIVIGNTGAVGENNTIRIGNTGHTGGVYMPVKNNAYEVVGGGSSSITPFCNVMLNTTTNELVIRPRVITITTLAQWTSFMVTNSTTNRLTGLIINLTTTDGGTIYLPTIGNGTAGTGPGGMENFDSFEVYRCVSSATEITILVNASDDSTYNTKIIGGKSSSAVGGPSTADNNVLFFERSYMKFTYVRPCWFVVSANIL